VKKKGEEDKKEIENKEKNINLKTVSHSHSILYLTSQQQVNQI
jgi:hypothetical protein